MISILTIAAKYLIAVFETFIAAHYVYKIEKLDHKNKDFIFRAAVLAVFGIFADLFGAPSALLYLCAAVYLFFMNSRARGKKYLRRVLGSVSAAGFAFLAGPAANGLVQSALLGGENFLSRDESMMIVVPKKIIEAALQWLMCDMVLKLSDSSRVRFRKRNWFQMIIIFGSTALEILIIYWLSKSDETAAVAGFPILILSLIIAVTCFYTMMSLGEYHRESEEMQLFKQQYEFQRKADEIVKRQYDEIRMIRHDLKQIYAVLLTLLSENKIAEAVEYLNKNRREIDKLEVLIDVGNDFVNAILNAKLNSAKSLGIEVRCCVDKALSFEAADLCTLLGNMLDNAIEACGKCTEKYIEINISARNEQCLITVLNSVEGDILKENSALATTKEDPELHGFGTRSILKIANKYDGNVRYFQEDNLFACEVLLLKNE